MKPKFANRLSSLTLPSQLVIALTAGLAAAALTGAARADATWVGDSSQDWNIAANWSSDPANPSGNFTVNTSAAGVFPILSANSAFTPVDLLIANGGTNTGRFDQRAGTVALANITSSGNWMVVGRGANTASGTYNLANTATADAGVSGFAQGTGSITVGKLWIGGAKFGVGGTGVVNVNTTGGITANSNQDYTDSRAAVTLGYGAGSSGILNLQSGTIQANSEMWTGFSGAGTVNQSGGTVNSTEYFVIGRNSGGVGNYNLSGGTVNAATTLANSFPVLASFGGSQGTLTVSGGGIFIAGGTNVAPLYVGEGGAGTLTVSGNGLVSIANATAGLRLGVNGGGTGTVNLNGGTIRTPIVTQGTGSGTFVFNGGTLQAAAANTNFMSGLTGAYVDPGGAVVDSNGFDITIAQSLSDGGGGLTKKGAGKLTLTGYNTMTGSSAVNAGTLAVGGQGTAMGALSVTATGTLRAQAVDSVTTPLTTASLDVASGGTLAFDFNGVDQNSSVPLVSTGGLTAAGTVTVSIANAGTLSSGSHKLLSYSSFGGGGTFSGGPFTLGTRSSGTLTNSGGALSLNVTADAPKWTGLDNGKWIAGSTGPNKNWKLIGSGTPTDYIQGDAVRFDDSVTTGTTAIDISAADVTPVAATFANATKNYTLGSSNGFGIAGAAQLSKTGAGSLVVSNVNTYTGGTTIDTGATLTLGTGASGGDGSISNTSGVANDGTLAFNRFGTGTAPYPISGFGTVVKNGPGTQILGGANSYSGGTTVNAGVLRLTTTAGTANSGTFTLAGGKFEVDLGTGNNFNYAPFFDLQADSTIGNAAAGTPATTAGQVNFTGTIAGNGHALNIANTGLARLYINGTLTGVTRIDVLTGAMGFDINSGNDRGLAPVDVANGASLWIAGNNANPVANAITLHGGDGVSAKGALFYEGGTPAPAPLTGAITLAEGITGVGATNAADTLTATGAVGGPGGLKLISGGLALTGTNSYGGGTTIELGRLIAGSNTALGTGAVSTSAAAGVQLQLGGGVNVGNALTLNGSSFTGQGALYVPTGDATYSGPIGITATPTVGGHFASGTGTLTLAGAVTSAVPVTVRNGTVVFANPGNSFGSLVVQQGTAAVGAMNAIPVSATVDLGISGAATLDLGGFNQTLAGITKNTNAATVTNNGAADATLTTTGTSTFGGVIQNGATRKTALAVASGALTLGGANTFTGNVTVSGGLVLADNAQLRFTPGPNGAVNSVGGAGTVDFEGDFVIDLAGASVANGNSWQLVNVGSLSETFGPTFTVADFTESGNVWTKVDGANTWTFSEATGVLSLSVGASSNYATWAQSKNLTAANNGATQDPDSDGISNALEFVLGGDPLASDTGKLPKLTTDANNFIFTFERDDQSETEIGLTFQYSSDLVSWTGVPIGAAGAGQVAVQENGAAPDTVTVTIPKSAASNGKLFGRLRAVK